MNNIILIVLDSVRRDYFYKKLIDGLIELINDFVHFKNCKSIYTATCTSHYTMFFGDYWNKAKNRNFLEQRQDEGYKNKSFCNGAIITTYPNKNIYKGNINNNRPFREDMLKALHPEYLNEWERAGFGDLFEDYAGAADDEINGMYIKLAAYLNKITPEKNCLFLHYWKAHHDYGIEDDLGIEIEGNNYHEIGGKLMN